VSSDIFCKFQLQASYVTNIPYHLSFKSSGTFCHITWITVMTFQKNRVPTPVGSNLPDPADGGTTLPWKDDNYFPVDTL